MEYSPVFLKLRATAFFCIVITSLLFIILLCFEVFYLWDTMSSPERSAILAIILVNSVTLIMLPILVLREFRPWLDAARFVFLLISHIGIAITFTCMNANFQCTDQIGQKGVCQLVTLYTLVGTWVAPVLLLAYSFGLALLVYRRSQRGASEVDESKSEFGDVRQTTMAPPSTYIYSEDSWNASDTWDRALVEWLNSAKPPPL